MTKQDKVIPIEGETHVVKLDEYSFIDPASDHWVNYYEVANEKQAIKALVLINGELKKLDDVKDNPSALTYYDPFNGVVTKYEIVEYDNLDGLQIVRKPVSGTANAKPKEHSPTKPVIDEVVDT